VGAGNVAVQACSTVVTSVCGVATITVSTNPQTVTAERDPEFGDDQQAGDGEHDAAAVGGGGGDQ
jgi:hypothetical protein